MPGGNCVFNPLWMKEFKWLQQKDRHSGLCTLCEATLDVRSMGKSSIVAHSKGKKHAAKESEASKTTAPIMNFFSQSQSQSAPATTQTVIHQQKIAVSGSAVLKAEILISLDTVAKHRSFKSCESNGGIFAAAFSDSEIAKQFKCGESKTKYLTVFGIAPFFAMELTKRVQESDYVLLFDESLNKELKKKQLDIHVRYWKNHQIVTEYLTFGHFFKKKVLINVLKNSLYFDLTLEYEPCLIMKRNGGKIKMMEAPKIGTEH